MIIAELYREVGQRLLYFFWARYAETAWELAELVPLYGVCDVFHCWM